MENKEQFLEELTTLCNKYKVKIKGCGCCGSPSIKNLKEGEIIIRYNIFYKETYDSYENLEAVTNKSKDE